MNPARIRLRGAIADLDSLLGLLDASEALAATHANANARLDAPVGLEVPYAALIGYVDPARLHRLGYLVVCVLGYAAFERFIRDLIGFGANTLSRFANQYQQLPHTLRDNHLRLTLRVSTLEKDEAAVSVMLAKLVACMDGNSPIDLNEDVFSDHQANFRTPVLRDTLRRIGIEIPEELTSDAIVGLLDDELSGIYARSSSVINDLADRRNQAAHGDDIELLDRPTLRAVMRFVQCYGDALATEVCDQLARQLIILVGTEVGRIEHTWNNAQGVRTICRVRPAAQVTTLQRVIIAGARYRLAVVQTIQHNQVDVQACGPSADAYGFDVATAVRDGERIFLLPDVALGLLEGLIE